MRRRSAPRTIVLAAIAIATATIACVPSARLVPAPAPVPCGRVHAPSGTGATTGPIWWTPDADADRAALARGCRAVGPVVVAAGEAPPSRVGRLAIVSWNTDAGRGDLARLLVTLRSGDLSGGSPPDAIVFLLQEARRTADRAMPLAAWAAAHGLHLYYVPSMRHHSPGEPRAGDRGNAIVSTVPLHDLAALELPMERQRRVAIAATIHLDTADAAVPVRLVNVHLENRAGRRRAWIRSRAARTRQAQALAGVLPREGALVLGGDLNTWSGHEAAVRALAERFDPWPAGAADDRPTFGRVRIDYLFRRLPASASMTYRRLDERYGSDHAPIVGLIRWAASRAGT